ncbi:TolC family protein, partial [bacterium]|nr:TolC family protein [bacterium]
MPCTVYDDLRTFQEVTGCQQVTFLLNGLMDSSAPQFRQLVQQVGDELGINVSVIPIGDSVEEVISQIPEGTDAVYVGAAYHLPDAEFDKLVRYSIDQKLPSFSVMGKADVSRGIYMGLSGDDFFDRTARRAALNLQRILFGEEPGEIPVAFSLGKRLSINMTTARAIGRFPTWAILTEADLISEKREDISRQLTLAQAIREAMTANLELMVQDYAVQAGAQDVKNAWSNLLPHVDIGAAGVLIDDDRAAASFGQQAEKSLTGSGTLTQVLFSEPALANLSIQKKLQIARTAERELKRLDIALAAATAYLNVLRTKTVERIQKDNLKLTRSNLEAAQVRDAIGVAGPAEVFRWEAEIANSRLAVIEGNSQRNLAEMELNRILDRPLEDPFKTIEADLHDPELLLSYERLFHYIDNPWTFDVVRDYLVERGLENSPELKQLDALIDAVKRRKTSATHAFYTPTLGLQADVSQLWWEDGEGTEGLDLGEQMPFSFPAADDNNWSVGVNLSFPLFSGGAKQAERIQASRELQRLEIQRASIADQIEQRIRSALHIAGASYAGIGLSQSAAQAADQSLNLVLNAYGQGSVSILELLDAQNAALVGNQMAANSIFNFLNDYMQVQRAVGAFDILRTPAQNLEDLEGLEKYLYDNDALPKQ